MFTLKNAKSFLLNAAARRQLVCSTEEGDGWVLLNLGELSSDETVATITLREVASGAGVETLIAGEAARSKTHPDLFDAIDFAVFELGVIAYRIRFENEW